MSSFLLQVMGDWSGRGGDTDIPRTNNAFFTGNTVISIFRSNQIMSLIPETPEHSEN